MAVLRSCAGRAAPARRGDGRRATRRVAHECRRTRIGARSSLLLCYARTSALFGVGAL